ncbi:phosphotransferase family protein [Sneathiella chinensis]|uniref:Aminoglycoside phosphotransferase n=2 Tax=Alphaproteobacteria TaxID=28211 RepID=A0ABQ5U3W8_9PROT|nr:phosphotransferase [Sneathiella chinensis]GLQ06844.1 putative aminoglycoside phosphotransferase [Sneathiella chinensis]
MNLNEQARQFLIRGALISDEADIRAEKLTGGISSDIWRVDADGRSFVLKQALPELRVSQHWEAPLSRNDNEVNWIREVADICPAAVPRVLYSEPGANMFAMEFLEGATWKEKLLQGDVDINFASEVGEALGKIHQSTANVKRVAAQFAVPETFDALRVEPYIKATAKAHPDVAEPLLRLAEETLSAVQALVHGDVSPKNILVGPAGPVLLDAECAWYGEPAFDLAFCLNHLLLKCLVRRDKCEDYLAAFEVLHTTYLKQVDWEPAETIERRTARLLPALFLARIDGKSPVEYVTAEDDKARVRQTALPYIQVSPTHLSEFRNSWVRNLKND